MGIDPSRRKRPRGRFSLGTPRRRTPARGGLHLEPLEPRIVLASTPIITEFMASNSGFFRDGDGNASDWIEIHNPTNQPINLAGWHLTDNADNLDKWTFPSVPQAVLDPGEYLIVFASSQNVEDYIDPLGYMHTDFALSAGGEFLALTDPQDNVVHAYAPTYPPQINNVSYGLVRNTATIELVGPGNQTSVLLPTNGSLDAPSAGVAPAWTLPGFNDASWTTSPSGVGVGFDTGDDAPTNAPNGTLLPGGPLGFDLTDPEEDGVLNGTFLAGGPWPNNETPSEAIDNNIFTKWLAFSSWGSFYEFQFEGGQRHAVNGYTITSANDEPNRDPYTWALYGSNDGIEWSIVDLREAQDFASRFETRLYEFSNNTAYEYYAFDFLTEYGATGLNQPNSIQIAEIELLTTGPVNYNELIDVDLADEWSANPSSIYQRIEFNVADPVQLASLLLEMQYDDGFVAYLNGHRVASSLAPALPGFQSHSEGEREDADSIKPEQFNLSAHLDKLAPGVNVLAIHILNVSDDSPDLLSAPRLVAAQAPVGDAIVAYMPQPTPGAINASEGVASGPIVSNVTENPPRPTDNQNLVITAQVTAQASPVTNVTMYYRVMFGADIPVTMLDNGQGSDVVAGDGIYTAVIPAAASAPGEMVRWYVTATDAVSDETRYPLFLHPTNSPQYLGTVIQNNDVNTQLPVFEYFVQNTNAEGTDTGTRASVYYLGEFYDNVFVRRRGGFSTQGRKFEFNDGYHFLIDPDLPRVDEINLNQRGSEPTYLRQVLSWEVYGLAGVPASLGEAWYTRRNDQYLDVRIFVEQPDADLLRRTGLDPNGAFYKIGADGVENSVTSSTSGVTKRTRKNEDNSDLQALVNGVRPNNNPNRARYVWDNIDIAGMINYLAATSIIHDNDHPHKNYHVYRDTEGSGQWTMIPWDKDLTFGINFGVSGIIGNVDPFSHPFFGDTNHRKVDNQWNRMIDAVLAQPAAKEMLVRRLRTLMDQFLGPPGTPAGTSWLETRVAELRAALQPHIVGANWTSDVNRIITEYLVERRQHLYVNHSITNPGYPDNARIPAAQVGNPQINFGTIDANPTSGNQDQEYIQLTNPNNTAVDISGWRLTGGIDHTFRGGTVIPAGGSIYVAANVPAFLARTSGPRGGQNLFVQGNYSGRLSNAGASLLLVAADNSVIAQTTTPGDPNPFQGDVLFSEVHYHPADPPPASGLAHTDVEFIEIYNRTNSAIDLSGWQIREGVTYDFPSGSSIPARSSILLVPFNPANATIANQFRQIYGIGAGVTIFGQYSGQLSNSGEAVSLLAPEHPGSATYHEVDRINFLDVPPWPTSADGDGPSLTRVAPDGPGDSATSWAAATPTPGSVSFNTGIPGDADGDGDVDGNDFLAWQRGLGKTSGATFADGDADGDGDVDGSDLGVWRNNFGTQPQIVAAMLAPAESSPATVVGSGLSDAALADLAVAIDLARRAPALRTAFVVDEALGRGEFRPAFRSLYAPLPAAPTSVESTAGDDAGDTVSDDEHQIAADLADAPWLELAFG